MGKRGLQKKSNKKRRAAKLERRPSVVSTHLHPAQQPSRHPSRKSSAVGKKTGSRRQTSVAGHKSARRYVPKKLFSSSVSRNVSIKSSYSARVKRHATSKDHTEQKGEVSNQEPPVDYSDGSSSRSNKKTSSSHVSSTSESGTFFPAKVSPSTCEKIQPRPRNDEDLKQWLNWRKTLNEQLSSVISAKEKSKSLKVVPMETVSHALSNDTVQAILHHAQNRDSPKSVLDLLSYMVYGIPRASLRPEVLDSIRNVRRLESVALSRSSSRAISLRRYPSDAFSRSGESIPNSTGSPRLLSRSPSALSPALSSVSEEQKLNIPQRYEISPSSSPQPPPPPPLPPPIYAKPKLKLQETPNRFSPIDIVHSTSQPQLDIGDTDPEQGPVYSEPRSRIWRSSLDVSGISKTLGQPRPGMSRPRAADSQELNQVQTRFGMGPPGRSGGPQEGVGPNYRDSPAIYQPVLPQYQAGHVAGHVARGQIQHQMHKF